MADHIYDEAIALKLRAVPPQDDEVILAVDTRIKNNPFVDLDDVTKVKTIEGKIVAIGKNIADYNAFDTGIFLCSPAIFHGLEESTKKGDYSLSGGIRILAAAGKARVMDIGDCFWCDIDEENSLRKAEKILSARKARHK
jgi:choline kinase